MSEVVDSPIDWVNKHIRLYVETDGAEGHIWRGFPNLLLTVTGRTSGLPRRTALIYATRGEHFIIVASSGGAPEHPQWYRNLVANPKVHVQVGPRKLTAIARTATKEEKKRLWPVAVAVFPTYEQYRAKTKRDIPVVIVTPDA
jgi:deazaflavin-dependent oxidoreductase (nitroreductase family)